MTRLLLRTASSMVLGGLVLQFGGEPARAEILGSLPSPHEAGEQFMTLQWCDTQEAMESVVDRHAEAGEDAADVIWNELMAAGVCHTLGSDVPAIATLIEERHSTVVTISDPIYEDREWPAIMEVWLAALDGLSDQPVYIARGALLDKGEPV